MGSFVNLTAADGFAFPAYLAQPAGTPKGGVVVLQEIFGVNAHIRAVADSYAAEGYLAIAPSTFHRVQQGVELGYTSEDVAAGAALKAAVEALPVPGALQDVQAAINEAAKAGKVAVLGYCWGGLLTWRAACTLLGISAAVPYYGGGMTTPLEVARQPQCPVLAHFGDQDHSISIDSVRAFEAAQPSVQVALYNAKHGFNCDHRAAFDATAAAQARVRTLEFLAKNLAK
jgi:carboxymethylenebutenolidase